MYNNKSTRRVMSSTSFLSLNFKNDFLVMRMNPDNHEPTVELTTDNIPRHKLTAFDTENMLLSCYYIQSKIMLR